MKKNLEWILIPGPIGRPYHVPSSMYLLTLAGPAATRRVCLPVHLAWSGQRREYDLADAGDRVQIYRLVLEQGGPADIMQYVSSPLLIRAWPVIRRQLAPVCTRAWEKQHPELQG